MSEETRKAVAYLRTSSRTNVGAGKDSEKRQLAAIEGPTPTRPATSSSRSSMTPP